MRTSHKALACFALTFLASVIAVGAAEEITTETRDGITVFGTLYGADLDSDSPLVLLFHQAGSNGRGEYADIVGWLNRPGFRAAAWDQRVGGDLYGSSNKTVSGLQSDHEWSYCDAYPDLLAALDRVIELDLAEKVILWGSSYSGSLVFRLAAERPDRVDGVIAFSPASGGPMVDCRARMWVDSVQAPVFVLRPASEMARASSEEQRDVLTAAGSEFLVVENGVHGSSMLVDERTEHDMSAVRETVIRWLGTISVAN